MFDEVHYVYIFEAWTWFQSPFLRDNRTICIFSDPFLATAFPCIRIQLIYRNIHKLVFCHCNYFKNISQILKMYIDNIRGALCNSIVLWLISSENSLTLQLPLIPEKTFTVFPIVSIFICWHYMSSGRVPSNYVSIKKTRSAQPYFTFFHKCFGK
jgi:hypothetical protein